MTVTAHNVSRTLKAVAKAALLAAMIAAPLFVVQKVNASQNTFIGETPTMSNGAGLVLVFGLQRS